MKMKRWMMKIVSSSSGVIDRSQRRGSTVVADGAADADDTGTNERGTSR